MLFALDQNNQRISPQKGISAICPICKAEVVSACGDINIHHWRHLNLKNCDSWIEPETEWHRYWKSKFPNDWQEIVINKYNEVHRADVQTSSGLVLELQNSSISNRTIQEREDFYENMIWLINAKIFAQNFSIRSDVTTELRESNDHYDYYLNLPNDIEEELMPLKKTNIKQIKERERIYSRIRELEKESIDYSLASENIDRHISELLSSSFYYGIFHEFKSPNIILVQSFNQKLQHLEKDINLIKDRIKNINELPNSTVINHYSFKTISFNRVKPENFSICKVVKNEQINVFFPDVIDLNSETNFRWYMQKSDQYTLIIDLTEKLSALQGALQNLEISREQIFLDKQNAFSTLKNELNEWLELSIQKAHVEISECKNKVELLDEEIQELCCDIENERIRLERESIENKKYLREEKKKKEISIKTNLKGLYSYSWKHRRPSWSFANATLFLDFGEGYIFEILPNNHFKKFTESDFIKRVMIL